MNHEEPLDVLDRALAALPSHDTSADWTRRTQDRCLAALAARRRRSPARGRWEAVRPAWGEAATTLAASVVYLAAAVQLSIAFLRSVR